MDRHSNSRERDAQGRFTNDDDDRRGRSYGGERSYGRQDDDRYGSGRDDQHRDRYGRFTGDDDRGSRGYSYARHDDDDRRSGGSRSMSHDRERDSQGRFVSDDYDRNGRHSRSYEGGGWSGGYDADRRGWDNREDDRGSSGRYAARYDDDRRGGSGFYAREDDDRRSGGTRSMGTDRDRDSQGRFTSDDHDRGGRYARDDDDRGRSDRMSSLYDDDRRSGMYSSRSGNDRDQNRDQYRGQGWFGDSEGHAEAARRGWRNR